MIDTVSGRAAALINEGYTEREAEFMTFAGIHSGGCFMMRHFRTYNLLSPGKTSDKFVAKLESRKDAEVLPTRSDFFVVYRLSRRVCELLEVEEDRENSDPKPRLMALDYVLDNRSLRFIENKAEYFRSVGIADDVMPGTVYNPPGTRATKRYFEERMPISVSGKQVRFAYIDSAGPRAFASFLERYGPLFHALTKPVVVFVSVAPAYGRRRFEGRMERSAAAETDLAELEARSIGSLARDELRRLKELRSELKKHLPVDRLRLEEFELNNRYQFV